MISPSSIRLHATIPNILRIVVPLAVMGICGTVLWQRMVTMDGAADTHHRERHNYPQNVWNRCVYRMLDGEIITALTRARLG